MLKLIEEETSNEGIKTTFELWKETANPGEDRYPFYLEIIDFHIKNLEKWLNVSLDKVPLIISGMASSSIGMLEVAYSDIPIRIDGSDLNKKFIPATAKFNHDIVIISGAKTPDDVMRGEETQLVGAIGMDDNGEEKLYVFTGTHSKHILVKEGKAIGFRTYMTGEFFDLLYKHSLLTTGLEKGQGFLYPEHQESFESGVRDSRKYSLLHSAFLTRVNYLLKKRSKQENYYYLSGLLIGYELGDLLSYHNKQVYLVSNETLSVYYETAFTVLSAGTSASIIVQSADEALIRGQWKMLSDARYTS
jgi:2-dehydro-3-deoxygalactonokinase